MKFERVCSDCRYFSQDQVFKDIDNRIRFGTCYHRAGKGEPLASEMRKPTRPCGPQAILYQPPKYKR